MQFWRSGLVLDRMFSNVNCHIQEPCGQEFPRNTNVTQRVPKLSLAESVLGMDRATEGSETRTRVRLKQNSVTAMTNFISKFCEEG